MSFTNATIVLSIGETVEEVTKSGFLLTSRTLGVALLSDDSLLQVHASGVRHIRADSSIVEWQTPGGRPVAKAVVNSGQLVIAIDGTNKASGGCATELIYFELNAVGQLSEEGILALDVEVCSLDVGNVPEGRAKFSFLAIGQVDDTVTVLSLERGGYAPAASCDASLVTTRRLEIYAARKQWGSGQLVIAKCGSTKWGPCACGSRCSHWHSV